MAFFQELVTQGLISQDELDGTRKHLDAAIAILKETPPDKLEAMVRQYDQELTSTMNKFNSPYSQGTLSGLQEVQVMLGYVTTIMGKSGLRT